MNTILIYSEILNPRIQYIFDFVFSEFSGLNVEYTNQKDYFFSANLPKVSYGERFGNELHFPLDEIFSELGIASQRKLNNLTALGKVFFALTRYEEYLGGKKDNLKRFLPDDFHQTPWVDAYILKIQGELILRYPLLKFKERKFTIQPTFDVDLAWKYKNKGFRRGFGGFAKDLFSGNFTEFKNRTKVWFGFGKDPYQRFDYIQNVLGKKNLRPIFFWLLANYSSPYDANNIAESSAMKKLILKVSKWADVGIHPSFQSNENTDLLKLETDRLAEITGKKVRYSRQHFIKISFPETYQNLIKRDIEVDFSLGYPQSTGFRAGTCSSFFWFDLSQNQKTKLKLVPFCAMDVSLNKYMAFSPNEALDELERLRLEIRKVKGNMVVLFHNSNFEETDQWIGWSKVFEDFFRTDWV